MSSPVNIIILISGRGSNMRALIDSNHPRAHFTHVISNRPHALGFKAAQERDIPTKHFPPAAFETQLLEHLQKHNTNLILLAGFMQILSTKFIQESPAPIINIHPSLLPHFPGLNTHQRVLNAKHSHTGATVHWVDSGIDTGTILDQTIIPVELNDTPQSLAERLLPFEHKLYQNVLTTLLNNPLFPTTYHA